MCLSITAGFEASPDGCLFKLAGIIVFAQLVLGLAPSESVVPEAGQSSVRDRNHQGDSGHEEQVRHSMVDNEALREVGEGTRQKVRPEDSRAVDSATHHEVAETPRARDVTY